VRTKNATVELSDKLEARGYAAAAINGDVVQKLRERAVDNLKKGKLDILVATDVAARGLDVPRISHVVNYDVPHDTESYVHRIGRTGRAGRKGDAILFVAPREKRMLQAIERATKQKITIMELPSTEMINDKRIENFKQRITDTLANEELGLFPEMIEQYQQEHNVPAIEIAAALAQLLQGDTPLLLQNKPQKSAKESWDRDDRPSGRQPARGDRAERDRKPRDRAARKDAPVEEGMTRYRIEVGHNHDVMPGNIVGAIANEANIESKFIGRINIHDDYSLVDLPEGMPKEMLNDLKKVWVSGQQLRIAPFDKDKDAWKKDKREPVKKGKSKPKTKPKKAAKKKVRKDKDKGKRKP
ncbi:MAG: helicase-related protein, partial [Gammaproteobacteria bacterium]|nr:helicase-related protein [Gammaproteobacteria bacterium]